MIIEGELAPDDVVTTIEADRIDLRPPGMPLVLFFYREAWSPASTDLARDFDDQHYEFDALGVRIVGVGVDGPERTATFAASCGLRYQLADDTSRELCRAFGVLDAADNRPHPTTFMIDVDGVVRRVFAGIPPFGHALDVVDDAREFWG
ncbi:MAG TPA: redoxin domain-containing protein [Thermoleophilia bacterium]|nr:redoxin domain-containing protein [Thermoleophilia bacterium]